MNKVFSSLFFFLFVFLFLLPLLPCPCCVTIYLKTFDKELIHFIFSMFSPLQQTYTLYQPAHPANFTAFHVACLLWAKYGCLLISMHDFFSSSVITTEWLNIVSCYFRFHVHPCWWTRLYILVCCFFHTWQRWHVCHLFMSFFFLLFLHLYYAGGCCCCCCAICERVAFKRFRSEYDCPSYRTHLYVHTYDVWSILSRIKIWCVYCDRYCIRAANGEWIIATIWCAHFDSHSTATCC